jgi:hypothetical protein
MDIIKGEAASGNKKTLRGSTRWAELAMLKERERERERANEAQLS